MCTCISVYIVCVHLLQILKRDSISDVEMYINYLTNETYRRTRLFKVHRRTETENENEINRKEKTHKKYKANCKLFTKM